MACHPLRAATPEGKFELVDDALRGGLPTDYMDVCRCGLCLRRCGAVGWSSSGLPASLRHDATSFRCCAAERSARSLFCVELVAEKFQCSLLAGRSLLVVIGGVVVVVQAAPLGEVMARSLP